MGAAGGGEARGRISGVRLAEASLPSTDGVAGVFDTTALPGRTVEGVEDSSSSSTSVILLFTQVGSSPPVPLLDMPPS